MLLRLVTFVLIVPTLSACTSSVLRRPQVFTVKKMAVVSVATSESVQNLSVDEDERKKQNFNGAPLLNSALRSFEKQLSRVKVWEVKTNVSVNKSLAYKKFIDSIKDRKPASVVGGLVAYNGPHTDEEQPIFSEFQILAKRIGVDAVAIINVDLAYHEVGSEEEKEKNKNESKEVKASVGTSMMFITNKGELAVFTPEPHQTERFFSDETVALENGKFPNNAKVLGMYRQAIDRSAKAWGVQIADELNPKLENK